MFHVSRSQSIKTGAAPAYTMVLAEALKVSVAPRPRPLALRLREEAPGGAPPSLT